MPPSWVKSTSMPRNAGRVLLREDADLLAINDQGVVTLLHRARVHLVDRAVLQHVDHVLQVHERVVHGHDLQKARIRGTARFQARQLARGRYRQNYNQKSKCRIGPVHTNMIVVLKHSSLMFADTEPMSTISRSHGLQNMSNVEVGWAMNLLLR